ncbi:MAG: glycerophosphodiester phosphodiesterase [Dehalococcoidia bacterium]
MSASNPLSELIADRRDGQPLIGAHRGGAAYAPENTLAAFAEGIRRGADMLELDIHLSREGEVVVIHDHTVDRTTNGQGHVHDMTVADLKRLDAGAWFAPRFAGERIPTLREAIEFVDRRLPLTIEVKGLPRTAAALSDALVDLLEGMGMTGGVLVIAFDHEQIRRIKERNPAIKAAINYSGRLVDPIHAGRAAHADVLNQSWLYCDRAFCQHAHAHGFAVQCFAPSAAAAWDLARNGVDIMDTDEPDVIVAATRRDAARPADDAPSVFAE